MDADRKTTTSMANTAPREYSSQLPLTGRQSEVFLTVLQEKLSWHWSVLQLTCPANPADVTGWIVVSCSPLLPLHACHLLRASYVNCVWVVSISKHCIREWNTQLPLMADAILGKDEHSCLPEPTEIHTHLLMKTHSSKVGW